MADADFRFLISSYLFESKVSNFSGIQVFQKPDRHQPIYALCVVPHTHIQSIVDAGDAPIIISVVIFSNGDETIVFVGHEKGDSHSVAHTICTLIGIDWISNFLKCQVNFISSQGTSTCLLFEQDLKKRVPFCPFSFFYRSQ